METRWIVWFRAGNRFFLSRASPFFFSFSFFSLNRSPLPTGIVVSHDTFRTIDSRGRAADRFSTLTRTCPIINRFCLPPCPNRFISVSLPFPPFFFRFLPQAKVVGGWISFLANLLSRIISWSSLNLREDKTKTVSDNFSLFVYSRYKNIFFLHLSFRCSK